MAKSSGRVTALHYEIDDAQFEGRKPDLVEVLEWRLILLANNILEETHEKTSPVSLARRSQLNSLYQAVLEDLVLAYHHRP